MIGVIILGAGTAIPIPGYSPAGHLVKYQNGFLLVDIGPGTLSRMAAAGFDYRDLDYVLITHHHSDHTLDLVTLIQVFGSTPGWTRERPFHLIGGKGTREFFNQLMATYPGIEPTTYRVEIHELEHEKLGFPGWAVSSVLTGHTPNSLGYRLEICEKSLVFSGDATRGIGLVSLAEQADVFICECSFPGNHESGDHLAAEQVGWIARTAGVKRLVLVHMYPSTIESNLIEQISKEFSGFIDVARDGFEVNLQEAGLSNE